MIDEKSGDTFDSKIANVASKDSHLITRGGEIVQKGQICPLQSCFLCAPIFTYSLGYYVMTETVIRSQNRRPKRRSSEGFPDLRYSSGCAIQRSGCIFRSSCYVSTLKRLSSSTMGMWFRCHRRKLIARQILEAKTTCRRYRDRPRRKELNSFNWSRLGIQSQTLMTVAGKYLRNLPSPPN